MTEGVKDCPLRDFREGHAPAVALGNLERLGNMPGDRLPLAVKVGGQPDRARLLCGFLNVVEAADLLLDHLVGGGEAMLNVD